MPGYTMCEDTLNKTESSKQHTVDHLLKQDNLIKVWTHWAFSTTAMRKYEAVNHRQAHTRAFNKGKDETIHQMYGHTGSLY